MSIFIIAEVHNNVLKKASREVASAARSLGDTVTALLPGGNDDHASELFSAGADVVIKNPFPEYSPQALTEIAAKVVADNGARVVLVPHSVAGKDFAGRLAVKMGGTVISDVVEISGNESELEVVKPIYSGKAYARMKIKSPVVITVRPNSQEIISHSGSDTIQASEIAPSAAAVPVKDIEMSGSGQAQLSDASIIISGGRGIKGPENWGLLQEACDHLGAALGASRAAVDAGWISHDHQVGQTGKTVSPNLYIAVGISGAIQHLAGMSSSRFIVAINKDPEAPIFKVATYGLVDDLFEVMPVLNDQLKKMMG